MVESSLVIRAAKLLLNTQDPANGPIITQKQKLMLVSKQHGAMLRKYLNVIAKIFRELHPQGLCSRMLGRGNGRFLAWLCILALAASAGAARAAGDEYIEYSGTASARHSQDFLYREQHVLRYRGGRLVERTVLYACANGAAFARKRVTYVDDQAPDFVFNDASSGMQEGVLGEGAAGTMFFGLLFSGIDVAYDVAIEFPSSDRKPSSAEAMIAAQGVSLTSCRRASN
jgi:hypothetical protein